MEKIPILMKTISSEYYLTSNEQKEILEIINKKIENIDFQDDLKKIIFETEDKGILKKILEIIEEYEYEKVYTYHLLYNIKETKEQILDKINSCPNINTKFLDKYSIKIEYPKLKEKNNKIFLKFSKILTGKVNKGKIKFPVIVEFFLEDNLFQIKFEMLESEYNLKDKNIYLYLIIEIENWLSKTLKIEFCANKTFDKVEKIIYSLRTNNEENLFEYLDYGRTPKSGNIKLKAGNSYALPLYDDLRKMKDTFCDEDKEKMNTFLEKLDNTIERYKRGLKWQFKTTTGKKTKTSSLELIFIKNFENTSRTLVHMYYNNEIIERRENAIKYVANFSDKQNE